MLATSSIPRPTRPASPRAVLATACLAQFMVLLDVAIVNVALPAMRDSLGFSATGLQWVVNAYTLTFAGFLLLGGRAADLLGSRRVLVAGVVVFGLASLACALATSPGLLLAARAVQGIAGAVVSPATLSIVTSSLAEGPERNRGLAAWGATGALGASSGALLGGILTQWLGWQAIFAINLPLGAVAVLLALRVLPVAAPTTGPRHFDALGASLVTLGLTSITYGIVRTDVLGWTDPGVVGPIAAGGVLLALFVWVEQRVATAPLMPLSIFRIRALRAANLVVVLLYAAFFPVWYFLTLFLQEVRGEGAIETGISFLPMTLTIFAASTLAPRLVARFGTRPVITGGMAIAALGLGILTGLSPDDSYVGFLLLGAVLTALGMGLSLVPATIVATQGVPRAESGLASGLLNTARLAGGAIGLAILSTVAAAHTRGSLADGGGADTALTGGYGLALGVGAAFCLAGALVAAALLPGRAPRVVPAAEPSGAVRA